MTTENGVESIGERLRRLRVERGVSQRALAGPGISCAYISRIEAGTRTPSMKALRRLAPQLGVSVEYLETGLEETSAERLELRLGDAELELRLGRDLDVAELAFRAVLDEAVTEGHLDAVARAQVGLGLVAHARGDAPAAVVLLEAAVQAGRISCLSHSDVFITLANAYVQLGTAERAVELLERCLEEATSIDTEDTSLTICYSTYLSQALADLGEYAKAERTILGALRAVGTETGVPERVRLHWTLARVAEAGGHVATAVEHMRKAIALLEVTEDGLRLGRAHIAAATLLMSSDKFIQAGQHLQAADRFLGASSDPLDRAFLKIEESRRATGLGSAADAVVLAREALDLLGRDNPSFRGAAYRALAEAVAATGDRDGAITAFGTAIDLLEEACQWREAADACTALGKYLRVLGRSEGVIEAFDRAARNAGHVRGAGARLLTTAE